MTYGSLSPQAELHFRSYLHVTAPLHAALVDELCRGPQVPLELATVLEDIGQFYIRCADRVAAELHRRGQLHLEPGLEDGSEAQIDIFVDRLIARAADICFDDGIVVHGKDALENFPAAQSALKAAILIAKQNSTEKPFGAEIKSQKSSL